MTPIWTMFPPPAWRNEIARLKDTTAKLRAIDGTKLSATDRDDRDVLLGTIDGQLLQEETLQTWRHDPGNYVGLLTYRGLRTDRARFRRRSTRA